MSEIETRKKLLSSRKDLLDIGLRNNMVSFNASAKSLQVVDERSDEVLKLLYRQGKAMTFAHMPEKRLRQIASAQSAEDQAVIAQDESTLELLHQLEGVDWHADKGSEDAPGSVLRHTDSRLQTALSEERLFLNLLKIHTEAETYLQEQGVNVLFLALGFLHWYEADAADKMRKAPLLLVPVELKRGGVADTFRLAYTGDELVQNLSLSARLKTDFGLDLPRYAVDADADELPALATFFSAVQEIIGKQARWKVARDEIHLGFFSFGKFLMFNDLDPLVWPEGKKPSQHPVLGGLLGEGFAHETATVADGVHLDSVIEPGELRFVRDADSSQTLAILEARAGRNLVIQGPPGTGKSQTITNIIAEFLGNGKTVLFVAEKMAALEVVKRRLDESHLGDAVLELHSHKATKQSVLKELGRTLEQGKPLAVDGAVDLVSLRDVRDELNAYSAAVNAPVGVSTVAFITALGHFLRLRREHRDLPVWPFASMATWTQSVQTRLREKVQELARHIQAMGPPTGNPFWGSRRTSFSPVEQAQVRTVLSEAEVTLQRIFGAADKVAAHLRLDRPVNLMDVDVLCRAAQRAAQAPRLKGLRLSTDDWQSRREAIRALIDAGQIMSQVRAEHATMLIEQAWDQNLLIERQHLASIGNKWWRALSSKYRQSRARLQGLCKANLAKDNAPCLALIDGVLEFQRQKPVYDQHAMLGETLFGAQWNQQRSDWEVLRSLSDWVFSLYDDLGAGTLPAGIVDFLSGHSDASGLGEAIVPIRADVADLQQRLQALGRQLEMDADLTSSALPALPLRVLQAKLQRWLLELPRLYELVRFNQLQQELTSAGLGLVVEQATHWQHGPLDLLHAFDIAWYSGLVDQGYATSPSLLRFDAVKQAHLLARFRLLDQSSLGYAQTELARAIWERKPGINQPGEMAVLRNELNKKRRLMAIRQLIDQAGRAIQQIKPVFMMSPMSIANFLPPGKVEFDVVIFDEASQVKAVDAFGAVLRGRQVIVVGDTRQMPPTDFFGRDVEVEDDDNVTSDIESILSMFRARGSQERYLSWHYRSRHESLIAVSNAEFYDRQLVIFPSSGANQLATGLTFRHLPETLYDRGRTRTNKGEAKAVAQTVMAHAANKPGMSLGVVAFSVAQRDLIQVEIELLRRAQPQVNAFFSTAHPTEPFFVKNLENVQGDERDVIFISIGYGRNESGRIAREFGPVNRDGGERRLNVLISRAKMAMEVFCNFRSEELVLDDHASRGVRALKHFLRYAETRVLDVPPAAGKSEDSSFEMEVRGALQDRGYQIEAQVGTAGYFLDMAVKDPSCPGRYLLAIECDGAGYHSARSARDRDRLRQGVLEGLGWRFHRIWSTEWFRDPVRQLERAVSAIESARQSIAADLPLMPQVRSVAAPVITRELPDAEASATKAVPAMTYVKVQLPSSEALGVSLHEAPPANLAALVKAVVAVESPVHETEVIKRLMMSYGVARAGSRIVENVGAAIQHGHRAGMFHQADGFVYADGLRVAQIRNRSELEPAERKIEWVAPEELDAALVEVVRLGFSISQEAAVSGALDALGFGRATVNITGVMNARVASLVACGKLTRSGDKLMVP
jgi:very-short-patch-repair endonuclease